MATSTSSIRRIASSRPKCRFQCLGERTSPTLPSSRIQSPAQRSHPSLSSSISAHRAFSTGPYVSSQKSDDDTFEEQRPRWATTPAGMSMPFRVRPRKLHNEWTCNDDPNRVAKFYNHFLGPGGETLLSEEVRWQAITHKSFDQGKRGFNDKLSYYGKRILDLQTSLCLAALPRDTWTPTGPDQYGRYPYEHPLLSGLGNVSERAKSGVLSKSRIARLGKGYGIEAVVRWRPKQASNLQGSGQELVMAQAVYAILGAVALERGMTVAERVAREKVLKPLGIVRDL